MNELLREVVSEEIERLADVDERLRMISVTAVLCEPDLTRATVLLSSVRIDALRGLEAQRSRLQRAVADQVRLKRTPRLGFAEDPSIAAGERVESVLRHLSGPRAEDPSDLGVGKGPQGSPGSDRGSGSGALGGSVVLAAGKEPMGIVIVDKEAGCTSHDVVARCRRIFGLKRVGHAGTLDPDATGVLVVGLGRATRLLRFLTSLGKTYEAEVVLGVATSTLDASGDVVATFDMSDIAIDDARRAAASLTGSILQVPPMVSALKVGGRRLYELAREGIEVPREARRVEVTRFDVEEAEIDQGEVPRRERVLRISVDCSSGTYVRSLAADLGSLLGGGAHLRKLRRTSVGSFTLSDARHLADISLADVLPAASAMRDYPSLMVDSEVASMVLSGRRFRRAELGVVGDGPWAILDSSRSLVALYGAKEPDLAVPLVVLGGAGVPRGANSLGL